MAKIAACPDVSEFQQILHGPADPGKLDSLVQHLERCEPCAQTVEQLLGSDTVAEAMKAKSAKTPSGEEGRVQQLVQRLQALRATESHGTANDHTMSVSEVAGERTAGDPHECLSPPQEAGEIGRLGGYRVLRVLGEGGMGLVYQAEDVHLQRPVALKVMRGEAAKSPSSRERFLREARAAARVHHDNIVTIYQVGEDRGVPFLAMEFLEGMPLNTLLEKGRKLSIAQVLRIGKDIAAGLAAAHDKQLLHRDIKPGNIWLDKNSGRAKLLDFGLARAASDATHLTKSGMIVGTPAYMAPEQGRAEKVDHRCDLFSLGCVLYELSTGKRPFTGHDTMGILMSLAVDTPTAPQLINFDVPPALSDLIMQLLEKDPTKRPASAKMVIAALIVLQKSQATKTEQEASARNQPSLAHAAGSVPPDVTGSAAFAFSAIDAPKAATPPPAAKKRRLALLVAVAAGFVLLLGLAFALYQIIFTTSEGTFFVQIDSKEIEARFKNGELQLLGLDGTVKYKLKASDTNKQLAAGPYTIKVVGADGLEVDVKEFTMKSGGKVTVHVKLMSPDKGKPGGPDGPTTASQFALLCDSKSRVKVPSLMLDLSGPLTIEGYVTQTKLFAGDQVPITATFLMYMHSHGGKKWSLSAYGKKNTFVVTGPPVKLNERVHVAAVYAGDRFRFFVNGKFYGESIIDKDTPPSQNKGMLQMAYEFTGMIDEVRISNVARYDKDFTPQKRFEPDKDTLALYHFDEGAGDVLKDSSGNNHHGKIVGAKWVKVPTGTPVDDAWIKMVAALPKEKQLDAVAAKLKDLNPGFDGVVEGEKDGAAVTNVKIYSNHVTDLSPLRALLGMKKLWCLGVGPQKGKLADLSPLKGLSLSSLELSNTQVKDLSPLKGMPLTHLCINSTHVTDLAVLKGMKLAFLNLNGLKPIDLTPLQGMPLEHLEVADGAITDLAPLKGLKLKGLVCCRTPVTDLSPLEGMPLNFLNLDATKVKDLGPIKTAPLQLLRIGDTHIIDLSPLKGTKLTSLFCGFNAERDAEILHSIKTLETINGQPAAEFWKEVDAAVVAKTFANSIGMKLVAIPAGKFMMGSSPKGIEYGLKLWADRPEIHAMVQAESPEHEVEITKPFYMGAHEVTVGQFRQFVTEKKYKVGDDRWEKPGFEQTDDHPVVAVSWHNAVDFCAWLSEKEGKKYRLPTEAEWEYCCRAGKSGTYYSFGDDEKDLGQYAWHFGNSGKKSHPVGLLKPNAWGLFDMHGNAWEWCHDNYDPNYYKNSPKQDPPGGTGGERVFRGGGWAGLAGDYRTGLRNHQKPDFHWIFLGFRVVCEVPAPGGKEIDLLKLIDVKKHAVKGEWKFDGPTLVTPSSQDNDRPDRLQIPVTPPTEYELELEVTRLPGNASQTLVIGLVAGAGRVVAALEVDGIKNGLLLIDGQTLWGAAGQVFTVGKPAKVLCKVSKDSVSIYCDGKEISKWKGDPKKSLSWDSRWEMPNPGQPFIGSVGTGNGFHISKMILRSAPSADAQGPSHALQFDGGGSVALPSMPFSPSGPLTLEMYVDVTKVFAGDGHALIETASGRIGVGGGWGPVWFNLGPDVLKVGGSPLKPGMNHVAGVWAAGELRLFVNGKRVGTHKPTATALPGAPKGTGLLARGFFGTMREVHISKAARYDADFTPALRFEADKDTIALYHFDEGEGDKLTDSSGNGHHGKIVGAKWLKLAGPPAAASADRKAAEWVLSLGGHVTIDDGKEPTAYQPKSLPAGPWTLRGITVEGRKNVTDDGWEHLAGLNNLQSLNLAQTKVTNVGLKHLAGLKNLQMLELHQTAADDATLKYISKLENLQTLGLNNTKVTNTGLKDLAGLKNLHTLKVGYTGVGGAALKELATLKNLHTLDLSFAHGIDQALKELARFENLQTLYLTQTAASGAGLKHLAGLKKLHTLDLAHAGSDEGLMELAGLKSLKSLSLFHGGVTDVGLKGLAGLNNLQTLDLALTKVTDVGLKELAGLENLQSLNLDRTQVKDGGLKHLAALKNLQELNLFLTGVSDTGLPELYGLKSLTTVNFNDTKVTKAGVEKLHAAIPQCKILSNHGDIAPVIDATAVDRKAAEWVLANQGAVVVESNGQQHEIKPGNPLPAGPLKVLHVFLASTKVKDDDLANLKGLTKMWGLRLDKTQITDAGLVHLKDMPKLTVLTLDFTAVNGSGFAQLKDLADLHNLSLYQSQINDTGLEHLRALKSLKQLDLHKTKVSAAGVQALQKDLPQCKIVSDHGK